MRKIVFRIISVIMAITLVTSMSMQIFATGEKIYISDLMVATGASVAAAKKKLKSAGYTAIESNVNENNDGVVLIGYKTTDNKDEAITDISVMNMKGGYRYEDYAHVLQEYQDIADQLVDELYVAVTEYRTNYKAGKYGALLANTLLNRFYDKDFGETDNLLGDILARDDLTKEQLSVIFMQATSLAVVTIESCLGIAVSDNWIDRLLNLSEKAGYSTDIDDKARTIYKSFSGFQSEMNQYVDIISKCTLTMESTEEEWSAFYATLSEDEQNIVTNYANTYDYLKATKYKDGTLYDFFMQDLDEIDNKDLYPLAEAMTDGQAATVNYASLCTAIQYSTFTDDIMKGMYEAAQGQKDLATVSVFDGVDRTIFEADGIALTNEAMRQATSTSDYSWWKGNLSKTTETVFYSIMGTAAGIAVAGIAVYAVASTKLNAIATFAYQSAFANVQMINTGFLPLGEVSEGETLAEAVADIIENGQLDRFVETLDVNGFEAAKAAETAATANSAWSVVAGAAKIISAVAIAIVLITLVIYLKKEYEAYNKKKEYTDIPRIIVDQTTADDGTRKYTYYYAVTDTAGAYADLNNWCGNEWNALYYTKDADAGNPILAYASFVTDSINRNSSYDRPVHAFGSEAAYNLNRFSKNSGTTGYLYFKSDSEASLTGTTLTYGTTAIAAVAGIAVGAAGMFSIDKLMLKKKKKSTAEA